MTDDRTSATYQRFVSRTKKLHRNNNNDIIFLHKQTAIAAQWKQHLNAHKLTINQMLVQQCVQYLEDNV